MIRNYLITAFRNVIRQKGYTIIIILGLTISIAVFGLILLYVNSEYQTDKFNNNYKQIYRLETEDWAILGTAFGPELAATFPEIENFARISCFDGASVTIKKEDKLLKLENMLYADSAFTDIFTFDFLQGDPNKALALPFSLILTKSEALKIFGQEDPMGKMIKIDNKNDFTITGIIRDTPSFHLKTNAIASFNSLPYIYNDSNFMNHYGMWNYYTFFQLAPNTNHAHLEKKIMQYYTGKALWKDSKPFFRLRPLHEIYFTNMKYDAPSSGEKGNINMLIMFLSIGIFIVIIACVNFINLTTAKASSRSKEIGVRKVMGASKKNLIFQFLGEAILITIISTELALGLMELLRPVFNNLIGKEVIMNSGLAIWLFVLAFPFPILIGIISGLYPAFYLNRLKPISSLKKERTSGKGALTFRRILITSQFTISIFLIVATLTVKKQLNFIRNKNLGFDKEQIITVSLNSDINKQRDTFREKLLSDPVIKSVAFSSQPFGNITWQESVNVNEESKQFTFVGTEPEFIKTMGLEIVKGRNFDRNNPTDLEKAIINEVAIDYFGLKNPIGSIVGTNGNQFEIVGVMKNANYNSLHGAVAPLVMRWKNQHFQVANIRINGSPVNAVAHIQKVWNEMSNNFILEYEFLDESFDHLYKSESRLAQLFMYLALLAIFIASIGLLGLASYLAEQRTKEIGIRKVLGASSTSIIQLLGKEFAFWVLLAGFISIPLSWTIMNNWLNQFAYHTKMDPFIFGTACALALVIAISTVSWQSYKSATRNPVISLRYE